jgi:ketosteroid isomerase-like protein
MRRSEVRLTASGMWIMALVLQGCRPAAAPFTDEHTAAIRDSVQAAMTRFQEYSAAAQWDSLAGLYSSSSSFRFLESGVIRYDSRAAIREALGSLPPGTKITTNYHDLQIDPVAPGVAMAIGLFETTFADSAGKGFAFNGAVSLLWFHEAEGWRIRSGHSSAPVPRGT